VCAAATRHVSCACHAPAAASSVTSLTRRVPLVMVQVVFSTSIMYNNFVSLVVRRRAAQTAREHVERVQVGVQCALHHDVHGWAGLFACLLACLRKSACLLCASGHNVNEPNLTRVNCVHQLVIPPRMRKSLVSRRLFAS
jgi:hypothetical protein